MITHVIPQPLTGIVPPIFISDRVYLAIQGEKELEWMAYLVTLVKRIKEITYLSKLERTFNTGTISMQIRITVIIYDNIAAYLICASSE
jgi:hypothetical protein